jgi:acetate---CoA ligase (ADP-forming)
MKTNLNTLFKPQSVAVVGVSEDSNKLGNAIFKNIISSGFTGELIGVNPKYKKVLGYTCYQKLSDYKSSLDLVVIVVPAKFVEDVVNDAAKANVANLVIISAGFGEKGKAGKELEQKIAEIARKADMRIVGPNCLGIISTVGNINASFASHTPLPGNIALLSQSGALNTAILDLSLARNLGFSHFVSFGNKSDINELDLLEYWLKDDSVEVVGMYLEEFTSGRDLINIIQSNKNKPIVLLYAGTSDKGKEAASSHTGSMTSDYTIIKSAMDKLGVILVDSIEKFFNAIMLFSWIDEHPVGRRAKILTNAGGPGILTTDMLSKTQAQVTSLTEVSQSQLKSLLPSAASISNPIDLLGDAGSERYKEALEIVAADDETDIIIAVLTPQYVTEIYETARVLIKAVEDYPKPIVPIFIGDFDVYKGLSLMWKNKIPAFEYIEEAVSAIESLFKFRFVEAELIDKTIIKNEIKLGKYKEEVKSFLSDKNTPLSADLSRALALEVGLQLPQEKIVTNIEDALTFTEQHGFPVVIKATTEDAAHKSDTNLIFLNIENKSDLVIHFNKLLETLKTFTTKEEPSVLIQEMFKGKEELILGVKRDGSSEIYNQETSGFGHMILFGKGGIYTEVYKDIATSLTPLTDIGFTRLIKSTKVSKIIGGIRGQEALSYTDIFNALKALQKLVLMYPEISEIDLNPLLVNSERAVAVDIKIFVKK